MVPEEEAPQEDGNAMVEDNEERPLDDAVSSTAVLLEPILIPDPMRATVVPPRFAGTSDAVSFANIS